MKQFSILVVMLIGLAFTAAAFSPDVGPPSTSITSQNDVATISTLSVVSVANVQAGLLISLEQKGGKVFSDGILQAEDYALPYHYTVVTLSDTALEPNLEVDYNILNPPSEQNEQRSLNYSERTKQE